MREAKSQRIIVEGEPYARVVVDAGVVVDCALDMSATIVVDVVDGGWDAIAAQLCRCRCDAQ